jgi:hypothetical protein
LLVAGDEQDIREAGTIYSHRWRNMMPAQFWSKI